MIGFSLFRKPDCEENQSLILRATDKDGAIAFALEMSSKYSPTNELIFDVRIFEQASTDYYAGLNCILSTANFFGCFGLLRIEETDFLLTISKIAQIGALDGNEIFQIQQVRVFIVSESSADSINAKGPEFIDAPIGYLDKRIVWLNNIKSQLETHFNGGFYYFSSNDITKNMQVSKSSEKLSDKYVWNYHALRPFKKFMHLQDAATRQMLVNANLFPAIMKGFAGFSKILIGERTLKCWLISRISCKRIGPRYSYRGLDDDGESANFVETENVLEIEGLIFSYIIIRGSVPVFWDQQGLQVAYNKIQLTRSPIATQPSFERHFENLRRDYGLIHALDLLGNGREQSEQLLSNAFDFHMKKAAYFDSSVNITTFDLNSEILNASSTETILDRLEEMFKAVCFEIPSFSYFVKDQEKRTTIRRQHGVFRVNCLDCLDRTNIAQSFISWKVMDLFLRNYIVPGSLPSNYGETMLLLNEIWGDNGDQLSYIYSGAAALKSSITRTGKYSVTGMISDLKKSAKRIYHDYFVDEMKHDTIRQVIGISAETVKMHDIMNIYSDNDSDENLDASARIGKSEISILAITWNVNNNFPELMDLNKLFETHTGSSPHLIAVAFQEIVDLNPSQIISVDPERRLAWEKRLLSAMNLHFNDDKYSLLVSNQLVGTTVSLFALDDIVGDIRNVEIAKKMTGLGGMAGNKGSVAVWLELYSKTYCVVASHFTAGQSNVTERNNDWLSVVEELKSTSGKSILSQNYVVWLGDLNYRLECIREVAIAKIKSTLYDELYDFDQLRIQRQEGNVFRSFSEECIAFPPTYKFDPGTNVYDTSEKNRVPSWTDRILYKGDGIKPIRYSSIAIDISDHKPVVLELMIKMSV